MSTTTKALLPYVRAARKRGFSVIVEVFAPGMSAMSAPIRQRDGHKIIATVHVAPQVTPLREEAKALGLENFRVERLDLN